MSRRARSPFSFALALFACVALFAAPGADAGGVHVGAKAYPAPFVVQPPHGGETRAVVVMLHGLGGGPEGWRSLAQLIPFDGVKWIFPNAPTIPVSLRQGRKEPAWYDMTSLKPESLWDDRDGILESSDYVVSVLKGVIREGVPPSKIVLGGFSQGGAVSLTTALHSAGLPLAGVFSLSSYLPMHDEYATGKMTLAKVARDIPVFIAHGTADPVLAYSLGERTVKQLWAMQVKKVEWHPIEGMGHTRAAEEVQLLANFIANALG